MSGNQAPREPPAIDLPALARRSATSAPAFTSAGVHEPSMATALLREISVSVLLAVTFGAAMRR